MNGRKRTGITILITVVLLTVFSFGAYFGYSQRPAVEKVKTVFSKEEQVLAEVDFEPFWKAWSLLESKYVDNENLNAQDMVWGAISGLADSLDDPYTVFFPPKEKKLFESEIRGNFEGVGIEIGIKDNILTVIAPLKDTPAYKAGIKAGDKILKIDDKITSRLSLDEAVQFIRGPGGTEVILTVSRESEPEPLEISIVRDVINIPIYDTEFKPGNVFVIKLYNFSENSPFAFRSGLREMVDNGRNKLIIDLRGNVGGFLEASVDIASFFLPTGKVVARERFGDKEEKLHKSKGYTSFFEDIPIVILIDRGTASAAEILAGALREHGIATLVGEKTFGKGSVQELVPVTSDTSLKITIADWLTPNGLSISDEGLDPDVEVEFTKEDFEAGRDPQMEKAIEIVSQ